jgi:DNA modification methylase
MKTNHKIIFGNAQDMNEVTDKSISLIVTSSPYPMIKMWDLAFSNHNSEIKEYLEKNDGKRAFELMNKELDKIWDELYRVLIPGGILCLNIGDAT